MPYISVNPASLATVANTINELMSQFEQLSSNNMSKEMDSLLLAWKGSDADAFVLKYQSSENGAMEASQSLRSSAEQFAAFLSKSAEAYEKAQQSAVERAHRL